ncbi:MAG: LysR family transcriptional regulator [Methylotenera sp.]|jgi:DNA-binding transcriptional LysR family regulator|nr:LysR family transcriptional regulator [Methylotenera sp.]
MNNRLDALRVFCVAADSRNFRDAAQRLGISPQVVTRVVKELEEELGEPLFHRSTRGVQLSDFGQQLLGPARDAVQGLDALFHRSDRRRPSELAGIVRIAAPTSLGRQLVQRALAATLPAHPGLQIDLRLSDALADVVDQQIDVGVRVGILRDSRFVARAVAPVTLEVVGTPALVERVGAPRSLDELLARPTTALIDANAGRPWPWLFSEGRQVSPPKPVFISNDADAEFSAICAGAGFGQVPDFMAAPLLADGRLVRTLADCQSPPWTLYVYRSQRAPVPARTRLVFDALVQALSGAAEQR